MAAAGSLPDGVRSDETAGDDGQERAHEDKGPEVQRRTDATGGLGVLLEVGQALASTLDLKRSLPQVLEIVGRWDDALHGLLVVLSEAGETEFESSWRSAAAGKRARPPAGDDVIGRTIRTGQPIVVSQGYRDHRTHDRKAEPPDASAGELSYVAVPFLLDGASVGAIGYALPFSAGRDLRQTVAFLDVVGVTIARAVRVQRTLHAERQRLLDEHAHLRREHKDRHSFSSIVGTSSAMREVYERITHVARTPDPVLLRGEPGTGKDLIAHAIHDKSGRAKQPFIKVSCGALPPDLIESELFGVDAGAFGGAHGHRKGRFEAADGGTLYLDEIAEMSVVTQARLLRVLTDGTFERPGGSGLVRVNVRLIAASSRMLEPALAAGTLSAALYDRLSADSIFIPPLRSRPPDVLLLASHFLEKLSREHHKPVKRISTLALDMLSSHDWPGNVRELASAIEHAVIVCDGQAVHAHDLPPTLQTAESIGSTPHAALGEMLEVFEKDALQDALKSARGNRAKAARLLATTERIFNYRVRKYGIDWQRFAR